MEDEEKTKEQLVEELAGLRQGMADVDRQQQISVEIIAVLNSDQPAEEAIQQMGAFLQQLIPFERLAIRLHELGWRGLLEDGHFVRQGFDDRAIEYMNRPNYSATTWVLKNKQPLLRKDISKEQRFETDHALIVRGMMSQLIVPLVIDGKAIGTFNFASRAANCYKEEHLKVAQSIDTTVALALKQFLTQQKIRLADAYHQIAQITLSALNMDDILDNLGVHIVRAGIFRSITISLVDYASNSIEVVRSFINKDGVGAVREAMRENEDVGIVHSLDSKDILAEAVRTGEIQVAVEWDERFDGRRLPELHKGQVAYFMPVMKENQVIAVLATGSRVEDKEATLSKIDAMQPLLDQVAIALNHAQLYSMAQNEILRRKQAEEVLRDQEVALMQQVRQQETLLNINQAVQEMTQASDLEHVLEVCLAEMGKIGLDVQSVAVHRIIDPKQKIIETFRVGPEGALSVFDRRRGASLTRIWQTGQFDYIQDFNTDNAENIEYFRSKFNDLPLQSFLDVPFSQGVISVHSVNANAFSDADAGDVKTIAEVLSVGFSRLEDLEELEVRNRELIRLERLRALGEMSVGVSHNLNNILTSVIGPAQILQRITHDPDVLREAEEIMVSAIRAKDLVHRLHLATRGNVEDRRQPVEVNTIVQEAVQQTRPRWNDEPEARGISIELMTNLKDVPPVKGSKSELNDMLINLILNAVDAMPDGGTITIGTHSVAEVVQIRVSDTGIGMDEETRRRVFEPFFTTKMDVGTGLGLSTVYSTVTRWGGDINVESNPGQGTTFTFWLPSTTGPEVEAQAETVKVRQKRPAKLLVVDDDQNICNFLSRLLSKSYEVETVQDGREALEKFEPGRCDVALINLGLPSKPGDQVAREMRQADPSLVTVLITGWQLDESDPRVSLFDFWTQKPFANLDEVEDIVAQAIELHHTRIGGGE